jgi:hypothetical protein
MPWTIGFGYGSNYEADRVILCVENPGFLAMLLT